MDKKKRKPNFSEAENVRLIEEYEKVVSVISSKFSPNVTTKKKHDAWVQIADAMNSRNPNVLCTVEELQNKWQNMASGMKDEYRAYKKELSKTGGGPRPDEPSILSQKIASVIGEDDPTVYGIEGGYDSIRAKSVNVISH